MTHHMVFSKCSAAGRIKRFLCKSNVMIFCENLENSWKSQKFMIFTCESRFQQLSSDIFRNWPAQLKIRPSENPKITKILAWNTLRWEMCKIWWACRRPTLGALSASVIILILHMACRDGFVKNIGSKQYWSSRMFGQILAQNYLWHGAW